MPVNIRATVSSLDQILHNALDGVFVVDRDRQFVLFNEACEKITGFKSRDLLASGCLCCDALRCSDEYGRPLSAALCPVKALFEGVKDSARQRMAVNRHDGTRTWIETAYTPVYNGGHEVEFVMGVMRDITEAKAKEEGLLEELTKCRELLRQAGIEQSPATAEGQESLLLDKILARVERDAIYRALRTANRQRNKAARLMGISRSRLYRRMEALGINPNEVP